MIHRKRILPKLLFAAALVTLSAAVTASGKLVELASRPDVTQGIWVITPDKPVATAILLPGGKGKIELTDSGPQKQGNFLVRTRDQFADHGLLTIVMDAPSDLADRKKGLKGKRLTDENLADIKAIVDYARKQANVPVWLVGTSRGTISASYVAGREPGLVNGIVLTSTVSNSGKKGAASVMDTSLENITVPVLLVHHEEDNCNVSPASGIKRVSKKLGGAKLVETKLFSGGKEKDGKECAGYSHHGYFKIEDEVVNFISDWIKSH